MKTTTTNEAIFEFIAIAQQWLIKDKDNAAENNKMGYAINRMLGRLKKPQQRFHNRREEIKIDTCMADEKGRILKDGRGEYEFTKDGLKECNTKTQELFEQAIEIEPYYSTVVPDNLTFAERESFNGFVLLENPDADETRPPVEQPSVS